MLLHRVIFNSLEGALSNTDGPTLEILLMLIILLWIAWPHAGQNVFICIMVMVAMFSVVHFLAAS